MTHVTLAVSSWDVQIEKYCQYPNVSDTTAGQSYFVYWKIFFIGRYVSYLYPMILKILFMGRYASYLYPMILKIFFIGRYASYLYPMILKAYLDVKHR